MDEQFDPFDLQSWYFGKMSREEATDLLMDEKVGAFLVRDSVTYPGDYALCLKGSSGIYHQAIYKEDEADGSRYKIGDRLFRSLSSLLEFYWNRHYLVRPATRRLEQVLAVTDFIGDKPGELPFRKGQVLVVIRKDDAEWWSVRIGLGRVGVIPASHVQPYEQCKCENNPRDQHGSTFLAVPAGSKPNVEHGTKTNGYAYARVKRARFPNAYDPTALKLGIGDIVRVTRTNLSGEWDGELVLADGTLGKKGHFPSVFVDFPIDYEPRRPEDDNLVGTN